MSVCLKPRGRTSCFSSKIFSYCFHTRRIPNALRYKNVRMYYFLLSLQHLILWYYLNLYQRCCESPDLSLYLGTRLRSFLFCRLRQIHSVILSSVDARIIGSFHAINKPGLEHYWHHAIVHFNDSCTKQQLNSFQ